MLTMAQELVTPSLPAKITDLPAEIYRQIFLLNDEKRLACLAATCRTLCAEAEEFRFEHISARSLRGIDSLCEALSVQDKDRRERTRAERVRTVTLNWEQPCSELAVTAADLRRLLELVGCNITGVTIPTRATDPLGPQPLPVDQPLYARQFALIASPSVINCMTYAPRNLTCLNLERVPGGNLSVFTCLSRTFGSTLKRLRVHRLLSNDLSKQSPIRILAAMICCRALKYLEIVDEARTEVRHLWLLRTRLDV